MSYYCRSNTTYCTYWPDCLQSRSSSLSGRASQPSTKFRAGQLYHTHRGSTSTIYALAAVIVGKGEKTRRSLQRPLPCNENCKQLACTSRTLPLYKGRKCLQHHRAICDTASPGHVFTTAKRWTPPQAGSPRTQDVDCIPELSMKSQITVNNIRR